MLNLKSFSTAAVALTCMSAVAAPHTLFYDGYSVELTDQKKTSPALHIRLHTDEMTYGALYDTPAPEHSLHIKHNGIEYWVGKWCDAGTYLTEAKECADCGYGHYCTGGIARDVCTGGLIGCKTKTGAADVSVDASLMNRPLTIAEAAQHLPRTQFADWEQIHQCTTRVNEEFDLLVLANPDVVHDPNIGGCPVQVIGPGTYLFVTHTQCSGVYHITAYVMVFDHNVSYKSVWAGDIIEHYVDTKSTEFTSHDAIVPLRLSDHCKTSATCTWCNDTDASNIEDLATKLPTGMLRVYRLK